MPLFIDIGGGDSKPPLDWASAESLRRPLGKVRESVSQSVQALSRPWEAGVVAVDDTEMRTCQGDGHGESAHVLGDHYTPFGDSCFEDGSVIDTPQLLGRSAVRATASMPSALRASASQPG